MPDKLNPDQWAVICDLNRQHPNPFTRGTWYPATMAGKPVEIRRTQSRGQYYLKIRKRVQVNLKDPEGNIINTRVEWEYFTVNLQNQTMSYIGW